MDTAFQQGPGFYCAYSDEINPRVPHGKQRVYCARLEAYDLDPKDGTDMETSFDVLFAKAEMNPEIAFALIKLHDAIAGNMKFLKEEVERK